MRDPADLLAHLAGLRAGPAADAAAARAIAALEPAEAAHALKVLVDSAKSSPEAGQALSAASRALMFGSEADLPFAHRGRIYDAAAELGIPEVAALFVIDKPSKVLDPSAAEPPDAELARLTLGHKKVLARQAEPDRMARLAVEGDGRVIRELLLNPKLTEGVVIRMAARRPAKVEALVEIGHSPKWSVRYSVRKALAMNPTKGLRAPLLPLLEEAGHSGDGSGEEDQNHHNQEKRQIASGQIEAGHGGEGRLLARVQGS